MSNNIGGNKNKYQFFVMVAVLAVSVAVTGPAWAQTFGFGSTPSAAEIAAIDIDAMPDGRGLPSGSGTPALGKVVYETQCAACHGDKMQGVKAADGAALIGGRASMTTAKQKRTVESYWPYATTLFDFVKRAMPFNAPGSLTDDQVYAVTAYILNRGKIIGENATMNAKTLPKVNMPNKDGFIQDPRPDVMNYK